MSNPSIVIESDEAQKAIINGYEIRLSVDNDSAMITALELTSNTRQTLYLDRAEYAVIKQMLNNTNL